MQGMQRNLYRLESSMMKFEVKLFICMSAWMILIGSFLLGQAVIEGDWAWTVVGVTVASLGGGIFCDMQNKLEEMSRKDDYRGKDE